MRIADPVPEAPPFPQARSVGMERALYWYRQGWNAFLVGPGVWIGITVLLLVFSLVDFIPWIGPLVTALFTPIISAGVLIAAREAYESRPVAVEQLFRALMEERMRMRLFSLGLLLVATQALLAVLEWAFVSADPGVGFTLRLLLGYLFMFALAAGLSLVLLYAVPLITFKETETVPAMRASFKASIVNILPLALFSLISVVLLVLALLPFGVGILIFIPVTAAALYASFDEMFNQETVEPEEASS